MEHTKQTLAAQQITFANAAQLAERCAFLGLRSGHTTLKLAQHILTHRKDATAYANIWADILFLGQLYQCPSNGVCS